MKYYNGKDWTFTWVNGRKLNSAVSGNTTVSYKYGADDLRMSKTVGGVTHEYLYLGDQLVEETWGSNSLKFAYDEQGRPYSVNYNGTTYYYILSQQGDVLYIVDEEGNIQTEYVYNAWGEILEVKGTASIGSVNPLRYRGYYYDTETGFYYLQSRYYDPEICRYISADGYVSTGQEISGYNMFTYCGNNPANRSDSTGMKWWSSVKKFFKKTVKKIKTWVDKTFGISKRTSTDMQIRSNGGKNVQTNVGARITSTTYLKRNKYSPVEFYETTTNKMTRTKNSTSNSFEIKNNIMNTEISWGMDGVSYTKSNNLLIGESSMTYALTSDGDFEYECGFSIKWDNMESTGYVSTSAFWPIPLGVGIVVATKGVALPVMVPVLKGAM